MHVTEDGKLTPLSLAGQREAGERAITSRASALVYRASLTKLMRTMTKILMLTTAMPFNAR